MGKLKFEIQTTDEEIILTQFPAEDCVEGALEGNTFGSSELADGVRGVTCQRSEEGGPEVQSLVFSRETFDEESAQEWASSNEFQAHLQRRREHIAMSNANDVRCYDMALADAVAGDGTPGSPENPAAPLASEGMEDFRGKVITALDARGWTIFGSMNPPYDFIVQELYNDFAIVIDALTGKYYKLAVMQDDEGLVTLGEPEEYDIAFVPADEGVPAPPEPEPAAGDDDSKEPPAMAASSNSRMRFVSKGSLVLRRVAGEKWPTFEVCIAQTGWSADARYLPISTAEDAVKRKVFDGVACNIEHPDKRTGRRPGLLACGFVRAGSVHLEKNLAGGFDLMANVSLLDTEQGHEVTANLDMALETGKPNLGCSLFSKDGAWLYEGDIDGRSALIIGRIDKLDAVDFVDSPAFPRAVPRRRLAAEKDKPTNQGGVLTMQEREELTRLRAENTEQRKKLLDLEREKAVDVELGRSDLPDDEKAVLRPILCAIEQPNLRTAQLALHARTYWRSVKPENRPNSGKATDNKGQENEPEPLRADVQEKVDAAAKAVGLSKEDLAKARKTAFTTRG